MDKLTTQIAVLKNEMKNITKSMEEGFKQNSKEHKEMVELFQTAISQKAGKWVENVLIGTGSIVGVAIITALLTLILK